MMRFKELQEKFEEVFEDGYFTEWAEDSKGGFGRKGWSVYGNKDNLFVAWVDFTRGRPVVGLVQEARV